MGAKREHFIADLREGKREALEAFYEALVAAKGDDAFWAYLASLVKTERESTAALRSAVGGGGFDRFVRYAETRVLIAFTAAALGMGSAGCDDGRLSSAPTVVPATSSANTSSEDFVICHEEQRFDATVDGPNVTMPVPPTAESLKDNLRQYIQKAQLPAAKKRRMLDTMQRATPAKIIDSEAELSALFLKSDPKEIAAALEALVLLKEKRREWLPVMGRLYKGADFG